MTLIGIFGPTASGKSRVAEAVAGLLGGELVSADAMQVYRGLPILTNQSPARLVAVLGNTLGTVAAVGVAALTIRRRPLGNALILAGIAVAAVGSALAGLGEAGTAAFIAAAAVLLYGGFIARR